MSPWVNLVQGSLEWISHFGSWAFLFYLFLFVLSSFAIPFMLLNVGGGILFGPFWGVVMVSVSATLSSVVHFLAGRYWARNWITSKIRNRKIFQALDHCSRREGWKIVGLSRMTITGPFFFVNLFWGATSVSLKNFTLASAAGMLPGIIFYVYLGSLAANLSRLGAVQPEGRTKWIFWSISALAMALIFSMVTRMARKSLKSIAGECERDLA